MITTLSAGVGRLEHSIAWWRSRSLAHQFLLASTVAIIAAMGVVGAWLSSRIESSVTHYSALDAALFVESAIGERIQGLADKPEFDPAVQRDLEQLVIQTPLGRRIVSFKIWVKGARIIYASRPEQIGTRFKPTDNLKEAWLGRVKFELDELSDTENALERKLQMPLLEVYVPIRRRFGGDVIAILELYADATALVGDITRAKHQAWLLLAAIGAGVVGALYGMARRASQTIDVQQAALNDRIADLSRLLDQNLSLRQRVEAASGRAAALNERYLRRIGSDLHDGPAQLITLALLLLDTLTVDATVQGQAKGGIEQTTEAERARIRMALAQALKEIRELSLGLSVPELQNSTLFDAIAESVRAHEHRTGSRVKLEIDQLPAVESGPETRIAVYRFLQEGLSNTRKHAPGAAASVSAKVDQAGLVLELSDDGPGFDATAQPPADRLGIVGMRERLASLGGSLEVRSSVGQGTRLTARIPLERAGHPRGGASHAR